MDTRIYKYNDGFDDVYADPGELDYQIDRLGIEEMLGGQRLREIPSDVDGNVDVDKADPNDLRLMKDTFHAAEPLIRQAFQVRPFDKKSGNGMLMMEVIELYTDYISWRNNIKKNIVSQPDSASPTDSTNVSSPTA